MNQKHKDESLQTLSDIKRIMESSTRFLSLSGWSGIWAGSVGLVSAYLANSWLSKAHSVSYDYHEHKTEMLIDGRFTSLDIQFIILALVTLLVALLGGYYFTWKKTKKEGKTLWNSTSKKMLFSVALPLAVGGFFAFIFMLNGLEVYIAPICLVFYGMALLNGSKYTLPDIQYLGISEIILGCINLILIRHGLLFWAIGFGALHIIYGTIMWNKYDKKAR